MLDPSIEAKRVILHHYKVILHGDSDHSLASEFDIHEIILSLHFSG